MTTNKYPTLTKLIWLIIIALFFFFQCGCSPVKKLHRLQKKYPYLFTAKMDTVTVRDTTSIMMPGIKYDTNFPLFKIQQPGEIALTSKEGLKIILSNRNDTVYVSATTDTVYKTIIKEIKVPYTKYETVKPDFVWLKIMWSFVFFCIYCFLGYQIFSYFHNARKTKKED